MRLAITMRQVIDVHHGELRDAISQDWSAYILSLWQSVILVPLANQPDSVEAWADSLEIDGAILSNGNDWGEAPERDATETKLVTWCRENGRPVLAACRGLQALNAIFGGTIEFDISTIAGQSHAGTSHETKLIDPVFIELAGTDRVTVNSYHDQGVVRSGLGHDLRAFALADGDVVEGFYHPTEPLLAIQWHPERPNVAHDFDTILIQRLFEKGAFWRT